MEKHDGWLTDDGRGLDCLLRLDSKTKVVFRSDLTTNIEINV